MILDSIATDLKYAIRQLRDFGDVERALDALSRIEMDLPAAREEVRIADAMIEAVTGDLEPSLWRIGDAEALVADVANGAFSDTEDEDPIAASECIASTRKMLAMLRAAAEKATAADREFHAMTPEEVALEKEASDVPF
jgi:hypothetical protein